MNVLLPILSAVGLDAVHSLEPGHGKSVMTAFLQVKVLTAEGERE